MVFCFSTDEIDAVLSTRTSSERDDSRRFKNEFLTHFDGLLCNHEDRVMVLGATNLPQAIDTAALRYTNTTYTIRRKK